MWTAANLVSADLPGVGTVRCHHQLVPALRDAFAELADRGLLASVDRSRAGCWNPRTIAGTDQPSRHAWGAAIDLVPATSDPRVIDVMERWGLGWGGRWLDVDPAHFEYIRPPKA